jgi:hypothetical protein
VTPAVSLVLISYNMNRQLRRTLVSLAPGYQRGISPGQVEVIVVDNGSDPSPTNEMLATPGLDLELHHWPSPTHSPVPAVNFGLSQVKAPIVAVMIDGARMASPGLVGACLAACRLHPRAVVATYNYHLGPKTQNQSMREGYDMEAEEKLLASIGWPQNSQRLFEISVPEVGTGWPGPMWETNALFMARSMWDELSGYDPRFAGPGGGAANPDIFERAYTLPGAQLIKVAGEGTFHQVHGGILSNRTSDEAFRKLGVEYMKIRGKPLTLSRERGWHFNPLTGSVT